jgi:hypothetical protein
MSFELGATGATGLELVKRLGATRAVFALASVAPCGGDTRSTEGATVPEPREQSLNEGTEESHAE